MFKNKSKAFIYSAVFLSSFILFSLLIPCSCSSLKQINKYKGESIEIVKKELGEPTSIIPTTTGEIYIYEKVSELKGMEINKGRGTLDPMLSPTAIKTERTIFTVANGKIVDVKKEVDYEKK